MNFKSILVLKLDVFLLKMFGLWPDQSKFKKQLSLITFILCCFSVTIVFVVGLTQKSSTDRTIYVETLMCIITVIGGFMQYIILYIKCDFLKNLYRESDIMNWQLLTDDTEIAIYTKFVFRGRVLSFFFIGSYAIGSTSFASLATLPRFLAQNESKDYSQLFPYYAENMIIHENTRYFQVIFHSWIGSVYVDCIYVLVSAVFTVNVARICVIYSIISYRLEKLIKFDEAKSRSTYGDEEIISELINITTMHKKAIKSVQIITNTFSSTFYVVQICLLLSTSLLIFDISYNMNTISILKLSFITSTFIVWVFCVNFGGEQIRQFSNKVFLATYRMPWYLLSINARKMLLMIIYRSVKGDVLNAGIMQLSLENFTSIMKVTWSLATVLSTTNKKM